MRLGWQTRAGVPLLFARGTGAVIAFTTRQGGVSTGEFASLNLGFGTPDAPGDVAANRLRALVATGSDPERALALYQVHGNVVLDAEERAPGAYLDAATEWPKADALVTSQPGLPLIAHGADCLTAALVAADGSRLATVHAGWRGLVAGVLEAAAERVGPGFSAVIGPGAGPCCYEVGEDVAVQLRGRFGDDVVLAGRADLAICAQRALERSGSGEVVSARLCTICDPEWFHSHRRDGRGSGRQAVIAYLGEEPA